MYMNVNFDNRITIMILKTKIFTK